MMNNRKQVNLQYYDSPCGRLVLASIDDELCLCDWNDMPSAERNMRRLARYTNASFKTETSSVLEETKSYKDIAQSIGKPQAVRAVAGAIGANGISILIPCHRVIGCNNSLTGYAGGLEAKKVLLGIETQK